MYIYYYELPLMGNEYRRDDCSDHANTGAQVKTDVIQPFELEA